MVGLIRLWRTSPPEAYKSSTGGQARPRRIKV